MEEPIFYLGIDWGKSKIGIALADSINRLATPVAVVKTLAEVLVIIKRESIGLLIIGKPVHMNGGDQYLTKGFADFVGKLSLSTGLEIVLVDERLSSRQAQRLSGATKDKAPEDAVAAMLILQSFLDSQ